MKCRSISVYLYLEDKQVYLGRLLMFLLWEPRVQIWSIPASKYSAEADTNVKV